MKFRARLQQGEQGEWTAECPELQIAVSALSAQNALDTLRAEIRYHVELCPCSSVPDDWVELEVE